MRTFNLRFFLFPLVLAVLLPLSGFAQGLSKATRLYSLNSRENSHPMAEKVKSLYPISLNQGAITNTVNARPEHLEIQWPLDANTVKTIRFRLSEAVPTQVTTAISGKKTVQTDPGLHYKASGEGWMAALSLIKDASGKSQLVGIYSENGKGNWVLGKSASLGKHYIYNDLDMPARNPFRCGADDLKENVNRLSRIAQAPAAERTAGAPCKSIKMFVEADYKSYVDNGRSIQATVAWIYSVFNVIGVIYDREDIYLEVTETFVHTRPDNYSNSESSEVLFAFSDSVPLRNTSATLAHLLSTENTGLGGIAFLDVLCSGGGGFNTGFSNCDYEFAQLPTYSWTANVIAHEIGHNAGSPHNHWCGWEKGPGLTGAIDSCYNTEPDDAGNQCYGGPPVGRVGTIMSYCHLTGSINLSLGFGPLPGALITSNFNSATCLSPGRFIAGLSVPGADTVCPGGNVTITPSLVPGATYTWEGPGGFTSGQRVLSLNNLQPNQAGTYYLSVAVNGCGTSPRPVYLHLDCIPVEAASQPLACPGQLASVPYNTTFANTGNNTFLVELSNAAGVFTGSNFIDTVTGAPAKGTLSFRLPDGIAAGSGYKVRLRTINPERIGGAVPVAFIIGNRLPAPTGTGATRPDPGTLTLSATSPNATISWYSQPQGGTVLGTGNAFTTPSLTRTTTFYAESNPGQKVAVGPTSRSGLPGGNLNNYSHGLYFTVQSPIRLDSFTVYPSSSGIINITITRLGTLDKVFERAVPVNAASTAGVKISVNANLSAGSYVITPSGSTVNGLFRSTSVSGFPYRATGLVSIDSSTADDFRLEYYYYFFNWRVTRFGCPSLRTPVVATIGNCTPPPAPTAGNTGRCGPGTVQLFASGAQAGQSYRWYSQATGGSSLTQAASFTTPNLTRTDTFYVSLVLTAAPTCESPRRMVIVTVSPLPPMPQAQPASRCGAGSATLTASGAQAGQSYFWYESLASQAPLANSQSYTTPSLTRTDTFYVSIQNGNCSSPRRPVIVTISAAPAAPVATGAQRCGAGSVTLNASGATAGERYTWFDRPAGGTEITPQPGAAYTLNLTRTDTFYVARINGQCSSARTQVIGRVNAVPAAPNIVRSGDSLIATPPIPGATYSWFFNGGSLTGQTRYAISMAGRPAGSYTVRVTAATCSSAVSQPFVYTSLEVGLEGNAVRIHPNPFINTLVVQVSQPLATLMLHDALGRLVLVRKDIAPGGVSIPVSHVPKGLYRIAATLPGGETLYLKAVKE